jgi:hypothetical protein
MIDFKHFEKAVKTRNEILATTDNENIKQIIDNAIAEFNSSGSTSKELLDFVRHLNSLFLTILITEGQDHSKSLDNVRIARELLKALEATLKTK